MNKIANHSYPLLYLTSVLYLIHLYTRYEQAIHTESHQVGLELKLF